MLYNLKMYFIRIRVKHLTARIGKLQDEAEFIIREAEMVGFQERGLTLSTIKMWEDRDGPNDNSDELHNAFYAVEHWRQGAYKLAMQKICKSDLLFCKAARLSQFLLIPKSLQKYFY